MRSNVLSFSQLIVDAATKGLAAYGRGAVLVRETVTARSVSGAGSGFGPQAQRQRLPDGEQQFDSVSFEVEYMPRWKMERPTDTNAQNEVLSLTDFSFEKWMYSPQYQTLASL